jgi:hypothetical protein
MSNMYNILIIPSDFNDIVKPFIIKSVKKNNNLNSDTNISLKNNKEIYNSHNNNLYGLEKIANICKAKDYNLLNNTTEYKLTNYINYLLDKYNSITNNITENDMLISLKLIFIYEYFSSISNDEYFENTSTDYIEDEILFTNLRYQYNNLYINYNNYCILRDYIYNYYGDDELLNRDKCKLNFNSNWLDVDEFLYFIKKTSNELMDYNSIIELINNFNSLNKINKNNTIHNDKLNELLLELKLYNIDSYSYFNEDDEDNKNEIKTNNTYNVLSDYTDEEVSEDISDTEL